MLNVYILEDDLRQQSRLEAIIFKHFPQLKNSPHFYLTGKPNQLLAYAQELKGNDIFFLDIEIDGENQKGLELARKIRAKDKYATIVFVTAYPNMMPLTFQYQVSAFDFIDKGLADEEFSRRIARVLNYVQENFGDRSARDEIFYFENEFSQVRLPYEEIYFIETSDLPHKLRLHGQGILQEFYGTLSELEKDRHFIRTHRSCLVNPHHVSSIDKDKRTVHFPNGSSCLVAHSKLRSLRQAIRQASEKG